MAAKSRAAKSRAATISRLKRRSEFLRVAAVRRKFVTPGLILQAAERPLEDDAPFRVGYTASRKVGNAVRRNRARRRLRAAVAQIMPGRALRGCDYVLIARAATPDRPFADLTADLSAALERLSP